MIEYGTRLSMFAVFLFCMAGLAFGQEDLTQGHETVFDALNRVIFEDVGRTSEDVLMTYSTNPSTTQTTDPAFLTTYTCNVVTYGDFARLHVLVDGTSQTYSALPTEDGITSVCSKVTSIEYRDKYHLWSVSPGRSRSRIALVDTRTGNTARIYRATSWVFSPNLERILFCAGTRNLFLDDVLLYPSVLDGFTSYDALGPKRPSGETLDDLTPPMADMRSARLWGAQWDTTMSLQAMICECQSPDDDEATTLTRRIVSHIRASLTGNPPGPVRVDVQTTQYDIPDSLEIPDDVMTEDNWPVTGPPFLQANAAATTASAGTGWLSPD